MPDQGAMLEERKLQERQFHNQRELDRINDPEHHDTYYSNRHFYDITGVSRRYVEHLLDTRCPGARALDFCCGTGEMSIRMAQKGADVTGIDISDVSIATAAEVANGMGLGDKAKFQVGDAENLDFGADTFDLALCSGVLHHVDLNAAYRELARVVKPGGSVIAIEALAHNPIITNYRRRTPHLRTPFEVDHILRVQDIRLAEKYFRKVEIRFFHLASIAAIPLRRTPLFRPLVAALDAVDAVLLRLPYVQRMAWQSVFVLSEPRKG
jgi:ubiquinone/menaquinone biosynthesis C-methylase UbiE